MNLVLIKQVDGDSQQLENKDDDDDSDDDDDDVQVTIGDIKAFPVTRYCIFSNSSNRSTYI